MYKREIQNLARAMRALRELVDFVEPSLRERADKATEMNAEVSKMTIFLLAKTKPELVESLEAPLPEDVQSLLELDVNVEQVAQSEYADGANVLTYRVTGADADKIDGAMTVASTLQRPRDFKALVADEIVKRQQLEILYQSALLTMTSTVEAFLSQVLIGYFREFPDRVGDSEVVTLKELAGCEDFDEAREIVIARRVDAHLGGGLEDWAQEVKKSLDLDMQSYFGGHWDAMCEVFLRRNLFAHAGGVVNSTYLSKVPAAYRDDMQKGQQLEVSRDYLFRAIDIAELGFACLAFGIWKKMRKDDKSRSEYMLEILYDEYLTHGTWLVAEALSEFALHDKVFSENRRAVALVNYWQSLKWQGRFEEIRKDVESKDLSAHQDVFRLAQMALLDDADRFFDLLPAVLAAKALTLRDLEEWPLFISMRDVPAYSDFARSQLTEFEEQLPAAMYQALVDRLPAEGKETAQAPEISEPPSEAGEQNS